MSVKQTAGKDVLGKFAPKCLWYIKMTALQP